jgi:hypothetical protein
MRLGPLSLLGVLTLVSSLGAQPSAPPDARDLWLAVVGQGRLSPIAAYTDDRWWFGWFDGWVNDDEARKAQEERIRGLAELVSAEWIPPGRLVPTRWAARLLTGRAADIYTNDRYAALDPDSLREPLSDYELTVLTKMPWSTDRHRPSGAEGVAVAGDARLGVFTELPEQRHAEVFRWMEDDFAAVNSDAYANQVELPPHLFGIKPETIRAMPFHIEEVVASVGPDGASYFVMEGDRIFPSGQDFACHAHSGVAIRRDGSGRQTLISRWSDRICHDNARFETPMAWVERDGEVCWIVRIGYEDGEMYQVIPPDRLGGEGGEACSIR